MATARLDIRLDEEIKAKAEKASALLGLKSLTECREAYGRRCDSCY